MIRFHWLDWLRGLWPTDPQPIPDAGTMPHERLLAFGRREGVGILDLRGMSRTKHYPTGRWGWFRGGSKDKNIPKRGRARGRLPWRNRTAIMLHITAVRMKPRRFIGCPCHGAVACDGAIVLCHPNDAYVWHGHAGNRFSVGIELSSTDGTLTDQQVRSAIALVRYVAEDIYDHTERAPVIMAHRQSHRSRPNDPGAYVWQRVAETAIRVLRTKVGPTVGSGREIPDEWRELVWSLPSNDRA